MNINIVHNKHVSSEAAEPIWNSLVNTVKDTSGLDLFDFKKLCTFVTKCAAKMPKVFGASGPANKMPYRQWWVECINHQLNSVMKRSIKCKDVAGWRIGKHLRTGKSVLRMVKHASLNDEMPDGFTLIVQVVLFSEQDLIFLRDLSIPHPESNDSLKSIIPCDDTVDDRRTCRWFLMLSSPWRNINNYNVTLGTTIFTDIAQIIIEAGNAPRVADSRTDQGEVKGTLFRNCDRRNSTTNASAY